MPIRHGKKTGGAIPDGAVPERAIPEDDAAEDSHWLGGAERTPREESRSRTINALLKKVEARLNEDVGKATLADYIKLIQLQKELGLDDMRELRVRWVDPPKEGEEGLG
jgi:hypothetical protein